MRKQPSRKPSPFATTTGTDITHSVFSTTGRGNIPRPSSNLAAVYIDMSDPKVIPQAEAALKKSIELSPSYAAYANLGLLYSQEKRYPESAALTEEALAL